MARRGSNPVRQLERLLERVPAEVIDASVTLFRDTAEGEARQTGRIPFGALLTVGIGKARIRATSASIEVYATPAGIWSWFEYGVNAHPISLRRVERPMPIQQSDAPFTTATVQHPGVNRWSGAWSRTVDRYRAAYVDEAADVAFGILGLN